MQVDGYLHLAGVVLTFAARIAVLWLFCAVFTSLLRRPNHRFLVWSGFSVASLIYWAGAIGTAFFSNTPGNLIYPARLASALVVVPSQWISAIAAGGLLFVSVYSAVVLYLVLRNFLKHYRLRRLLSLGTPASQPFNTALRSLCAEFGVKRCELVVLPVISSPAVVYWWNPRMLVPEACHREERLQQFTHIMRHELIHIVRRDFLLATLADGIFTILFFHPAIWWARKRMRMERELACDLAVVEACPQDRADYAGSLASLVRLNLNKPSQPPGVAFSAPASFVGKRIRSILVLPEKASPARKLFLSGTAAAMLSAFAVCTPWISLALNVSDETTGPAAQSCRQANNGSRGAVVSNSWFHVNARKQPFLRISPVKQSSPAGTILNGLCEPAVASAVAPRMETFSVLENHISGARIKPSGR